jgi:hypothetical protein
MSVAESPASNTPATKIIVPSASSISASLSAAHAAAHAGVLSVEVGKPEGKTAQGTSGSLAKTPATAMPSAPPASVSHVSPASSASPTSSVSSVPLAPTKRAAQNRLDDAQEITDIEELFPEIYAEIKSAAEENPTIHDVFDSFNKIQETNIQILRNESDDYAASDDEEKLEAFNNYMLDCKQKLLRNSSNQVEKIYDVIIDRVISSYVIPLKKYIEKIDPEYVTKFKQLKQQIKRELMAKIDEIIKRAVDHNKKIFEIMEKDLSDKVKVTMITKIVLFD